MWNRLTIIIRCAAALACLVGCATAVAAPWATGPALQKALDQEIDILWSGNPLRQAVEGLGRAQRVAILIDRRVDPSQKLEMKINGMSVDTALRQIAGSCGLGVSRLGDVMYLGPPEAAERLQALASLFEREVRRLPPAARRKLLQRKPLAWDDLDSPQDILTHLGKESGLNIVGLERVPHDLWAAADLPPASLIDRLALIANQYDQTFSVSSNGSSVELGPMPEGLLNRLAGRRKPSTSADAASKDLPDETPAVVEQTRIKRLSVREKPLGLVLKELSKQLDLEVRMDEEAIQAAGISIDQRVSITVENAGVDALFRELLQSTGLTFHRRQRVVEIVPAQ